jgi:hypothetical protein
MQQLKIWNKTWKHRSESLKISFNAFYHTCMYNESSNATIENLKQNMKT